MLRLQIRRGILNFGGDYSTTRDVWSPPGDRSLSLYPSMTNTGLSSDYEED